MIGDVIPKFKEIRKFLVESPETLLDETSLQGRVTTLISHLARFKIEDKQKL